MLELEFDNSVLTAHLSGELDHHTAAVIRKKIDAKTETLKPKTLKLDYKNVQFMDSSGIGLIMGRYKIVSKSGGKLHVSGVTPQNYKVMKLAGLERLSVLDETSVMKG